MSGWNTIESDAGVFTELIERIGVKGAEFEELLSIDPDSLSLVQPLYGAIFLFKYRGSERTGQPLDGTYDTEGNVFFACQKIQNACATQAVLSLVLNSPEVALGDTLSEFKAFVESFDPDLKGEAISNSDVIRTVHNSFSRPSPFIDEDDSRPERDENDDGLYHFIAYAPINGLLYELDGLHPYPISHGPCAEGEFSDKLSEVLTRRVSRAPEGEMRFNLLGLTNDKRDYFRQLGDAESLAREQAKRDEWARENSLRRENFVGLIHALTKSVASKATDEQWQSLILEGRERSKRRQRAQ